MKSAMRPTRRQTDYEGTIGARKARIEGKRRQRGTARRGGSQVGKGKGTRKGGLQDTAGGLRHPQKSRICFLVVEQSWW